jgi:hypothetical protein
MRVAAHPHALQHHHDRRHVQKPKEIDRRSRNEAHPRSKQRSTGSGLGTHAVRNRTAVGAIPEIRQKEKGKR